MEKLDIRPIIDAILENVKKHELEQKGAYRRWLWQDAKGRRNLGINEYGCADAMNILYTIGRFPKGKDREDALKVLRSLQHEDTGLFEEDSREYKHHPMHTTAHCAAAIELFDEEIAYKPTALMKYFTKEGLYELLDSLDWRGNPWAESHKGAGIFVTGILTNSVDLEWQRAYFDYLYDNTDPDWGMSKQGYIDTDAIGPHAHLNGWFHYMFNMQYAKKPLKYPDKLIDSCLKMYNEDLLGERFAYEFGFREIDWVFAINRAARETPHRFAEVKAALLDFAKKFIPYLDSVDYEKNDGANDLHMLFGTICALAELQAALPGVIESSRPLKLVLDRRPFI